MVSFPAFLTAIVAETFRSRDVATAATAIAGEIGRIRAAGP